eukprot:6138649-Pyramimonas_sp.AAC.1
MAWARLRERDASGSRSLGEEGGPPKTRPTSTELAPGPLGGAACHIYQFIAHVAQGTDEERMSRTPRSQRLTSTA